MRAILLVLASSAALAGCSDESQPNPGDAGTPCVSTLAAWSPSTRLEVTTDTGVQCDNGVVTIPFASGSITLDGAREEVTVSIDGRTVVMIPGDCSELDFWSPMIVSCNNAGFADDRVSISGVLCSDCYLRGVME